MIIQPLNEEESRMQENNDLQFEANYVSTDDDDEMSSGDHALLVNETGLINVRTTNIEVDDSNNDRQYFGTNGAVLVRDENNGSIVLQRNEYSDRSVKRENA